MDYTKRIIELFSNWVGQINAFNKLGRQDINRCSENIALYLLNRIYNYKLRNLNDIQEGYPGIDLGDEDNKIAFQITSSFDNEKIKENLKTFSTKDAQTYTSGIYFLILTLGKKPRYIKKTKDEFKDIYPSFDHEDHIWTLNKLVKKINAFKEEDKSKVQEIIKYLEEKLNVIRKIIESRCPFRGLEVFRKEDKDIFFGRGEVVMKLVKKLESSRFLAVLGPSGIGKSSLVQAGLIPGLGEDVSVTLFTPCENPIDELAVALCQCYPKNKRGVNEMIMRLKKPDKNLQLIAKEVLDNTQKKKFIIVIDQFEEIFIHTIYEKERREFIQIILNVLKKQELPMKIILIMRSDFIGKFADHPKLNEYVNKNFFQVGPMSSEELKCAIKEPVAKDAMLNFEHGLENLILNDVKNVTDKLPLLEHVLLELYKRGKGKQMTSDDYTDIGRINGALVNHVESEFEKLDKVQKKIIREIFVKHLIKYGEGTDFILRRATKEKLLDVGGESQATKVLLDRWINAHLLTVTKDPVRKKEFVYIAHEVLIRKWDRIQTWLGENENRIKELKLKYNRIIKRIIIMTFIVLLLLVFGTVVQMKQVKRKNKEALSNKLAAKSSFMLSKDNIKSIRIAEAAYKIGIPNASPASQFALTKSAYSTFERPIYSTYMEHEDKITSVLFSPNSKKILTTSMDSTAKLWDLNGKLLADLNSHKGPVTKAVFSSNGTNILTASNDNFAKLWNSDEEESETKKWLKFSSVGLKHDNIVLSVIFSPDDSKILTASRDTTAKLWDLDGTPLTTIEEHKSQVKSAFFLDDGKKIITISSDNTAKIWDLSKDSLPILNNSKYVLRLFSCQGTKMLSTPDYKTVELWDIKEKYSINLKHTSTVNSAVFSEKGNMILTSSDDHTAKLWDIKGNLSANFKHSDKVLSAVFSSNGDKILTASGNSAKLWDLKGNLVHCFNKHENDLKDAIFSPNDKMILTWSGRTVKLWDLQGHLLAHLNKHSDLVSWAKFSPDSKNILICSGKTAKLYKLGENFLTNLHKYMDSIRNAAISPDGTKLLTWVGNTAKLWNNKGRKLADLKNHTAAIFIAAFSSDCTRIITASEDNTAILWNLKDTSFKVFPHTDALSSAAISSNGSKILTVSRYNTVLLWDSNGKLEKDFSKYFSDIKSAILSPDGSKILSWSGNKANLLDLKGNIIAHLNNHTGYIMSAIFSSDGKKIITTSLDNTAKIWDLQGNLLADLKEHKGPVTGAVFSRDGSMILTISYDNTAKLWDLKGNLLADLNKHTDDVLSAAFSLDGKRIITVSKDGTVKSWYTPEAIIKWLEDAPIPKLSQEDKENLGIADFEIE